LQKNYGWLWIAVDRPGKRFLNCEVGSRDTETGRKLWGSIKNDGIAGVMSDYWKPYDKFVPPDLHTAIESGNLYRRGL
jgi:insertion element IS1 protein InsB